MKELKKAQMGMIAMLAVMLVSMKRRLPEARRLSSGITTLALAGIVLLVAAGSASADTEINVTSFGGGDYNANIANERYYLTADLTADPAKSGIIIGANGVTIDGQGHYISGGTPGSCPGIESLTGEKGGDWARPGILVKSWELATIKNIEVKNFCTGILLYGATAKNERHTVENCSVHDNGNPNVQVDVANFQGLALYKKVCNCTINNNTVYNSYGKLKSGGGDCDDNGAGISFKVSCKDNDITNNTCYNNTLAGLYSKAGGGDCYNLIFNNTVYENGKLDSDAAGFTGGIRLQCKSTDDNTIANNTVTDNFGPGIFIGGNDCFVRNNTVTDNKDANTGPNCRGDGLRIDRYGDGGGKNTIVEDNFFCDNEHLDINVQNAGAGTTGDHNYCDTGVNYQDTSASGSDICEFPCPEKPDLVIIDKHEDWIVVGSTYNVTYTVENQGGAASVASETALYIGGVYDSSDTTVPALNPSDNHTYTFAGPFTFTAPVEISLFADSTDANDECDEDNWYNNTLSTLKIYVDPPLTNVSPQDQFDINITINPGGLQIYGVEYYLTYSTAIVRAESQVKGPFLGPASDTVVVVNEIDRTNGIVSYAETRKVSGGVTEENISSVIQFTAIGPADTCIDLVLSGVIIVNVDGDEVTALIEDGEVCIIRNNPPEAKGCTKHLHNNAQKKFECLAQLCSNSIANDPDQDIVYIRWSFGDGEYGTSEGLGDCPCKYHSYTSWIWEPFGATPANGGHYEPFTVELTVTDNGDPQLEDTTYFNVSVYLAGDANADGTVNILDAVLIGLSWGDTCEDPTACCELLWATERSDRADLNNDCKVNILDAVIVGTMWNHNAYYPV